MLREKGIEFFPGGFFPAGAWTLLLGDDVAEEVGV